jgi:parvulin-like peptidyl-prolyl isomerase
MLKLPVIIVACVAVAGVLAEDRPATTNSTVLATIGDEPITEADFQLYCAIHNIPEKSQAEVRSKLLNNLIERRLIRRFLADRKIAADPEELASHRVRLEDLIRRRGDDPQALLERLGLTEDILEEELGLPLAWSAYLRVAVSDEQMQKYYERRRAEIDGTKLRASQIILKLPPKSTEKAVAERKAKLAVIRKEIVSNQLTFAQAAQKYSEAPSKSKGGDVGWFPFRGKMAVPFCDAAFALKVGEVSEPVAAPYGVFLIQVTDIQPGELSLEDVRSEIVARISQQRWAEAIAAERQKRKVTVVGQ